MASSLIFKILPVISEISEGMRVIILTVVISLLAAFLFPVDDDEARKDGEKNEA